jgi:signal transduction histidine kinase
LWSGGTTLAVLVVLGFALYAVVGRQIADDAERQLRARADSVASIAISGSAAFIDQPSILRGLRIATDVDSPGYVFGGPLSGTLAVIIAAGGEIPVEAAGHDPRFDGSDITAGAGVIGAVGSGSATPLVGEAGLEAARSGFEGLAIASIAGTPVRVLSVPIEGAGGRVIIQVMSDMTLERRVLDGLLTVLLVGGTLVVVAAGLAGWTYAGRALVPMRESLRRQREFAADASHELRTPLSALRSDLDAVSRLAPEDRGASDALSEALGETDRMTKLVDSLLVLARTDADASPLMRAALDLADEASSAVDGLERTARERTIAIVLQVPPTPMEGDAARLRQLVTILVDNALRYGDVGGNVWVTVRPDGQRASLSVADDGPGIPVDDHERIFGRFWRGATATATEDGSGLGLAIAHWIVAAHNGSIVAGARPGGGAELLVSLAA